MNFVGIMYIKCENLIVKQFPRLNSDILLHCFLGSWLRHPRIKENWKTVTAAFLLFVAGIGVYIIIFILQKVKVFLNQTVFKLVEK